MPLPLDTRVVSLKLLTTLLIVPLPETLVAAVNVMPRLLLALSSKPVAPVTVLAVLDEPKPLYVSPLAALPALPPLSAKLAVPVMLPPLAVVNAVKPAPYVMPLPPEKRVLSLKLLTTLLIVPLPETLVALAKAIPAVVLAVSSKPMALVTVVVSAALNPL